jgi:hypothetical protein
MLEKISSIEMHYKSNITILTFGFLFLAMGFVMSATDEEGAMLMGLFIGSLCLFIYYIRRRHVVSIASDGGAKIHFLTKGMNRKALLDFINKIEEAKKNRITH